MSDLNYLLDQNSTWAAQVISDDPDFFRRLDSIQAPKFLWIGCSDSRVPANQITGMQPGEVFVHRNVANVVAHGDLNCLSTIQYAVDLLKVEHIIVCGHYGCGGVNATLIGQRIGLVDNWLRHVGDVMDKHHHALENFAEETRLDVLCELNVIEQANNVCQSTVMIDAWRRNQKITVHAWVYALKDGRLKALNNGIGDLSQVHDEYRQAIKSSLERNSD
jgi:carbonic anhydrase